MKIILFYLIVLISYFSIIGYGTLFNNKYLKNHKNKSNLINLLNFIIGLIILNIIGFFLYLLHITNVNINAFVIVIGLILFFQQSKTIESKELLISSFILLLIFSGLLISKTHEDFIPYHFPFIEIVTNSKLILGLGKVEINYIYTPLISYVQKLFVLPFYDYRLLHIPIFLLYFSIINYLIKEIFLKNKINLIFVFILIFYLTKFTRLSEYGYDYLITFLITVLIILLINEVKNNNKKIDFFIYILIFFYSVTIKNIAIFFLPILMVIFFYKKKDILIGFKNVFNTKIPLILFTFILCLTYVLESFLKSGCLINFFIPSCIENKIIFWAVDKTEILEISNHVKLWAKGFYHQPENHVLSSDIYMSEFNWFSNWFNIHFHYKVIEFLGILTFIFFIIYLLSLSKNEVVDKRKKINKIFILFSLISISIWFLIIPQLRFGAGLILTFYIFTLGFILDVNDRIFKSKKYIIAIVCFSIFFFNLKNINRVSDEIKRADKYKFNNFPFISVTDYAKPSTFNKRFDNALKKRFLN